MSTARTFVHRTGQQARDVMYRARWAIALLVICAFAGASAGVWRPPLADSPTTANVEVWPWPFHDWELQAVGLVQPLQPSTRGGVQFARELALGSGRFTASGSNQRRALDTALAAARTYVDSLVHRQNDVLERLTEEQRGTPSVQKLRLRILHAQQRYALLYTQPQRARGRPFLGALLGFLVGLSLLSLSETAVRLGGARSVAPGPRTASRLIGLIVGAAAAIAVVATTPGHELLLYGFALGIPFAAGLNLALSGATTSRALILLTIIVAPLRGALLSLAHAVGMPHAFFIVNAIAPAVVLCLALANVKRLTPRLRPSNPFQWALLGIVVVSVLDLTTQTGGLRLFAVGFVQYLTYPALAFFAWNVRQPLDDRRLSLILASMAGVVALSVFAEAAHLIRFTEAAAPVVPFLNRPRWGGATGSYLHASIFLGTSVPIVVGMLLGDVRPRAKLALSAGLLLILGALFLTNSRGGVAIAVLGVLALLLVVRRQHRVRLVAAAAAVATILVGLAFIGAGPTQIAPRLRTTFDVSNDPANVGRLATMRRSLRQFDRAPLREQLFGEGLATTGNTRKLVALPGTSTENYFLKLLLEVGAVGLLAVGGFIVWGVGVLTVVARRAKGDPGLQGACTAAFALATYGLAYPVLEPQVTAMTWWLLLAAAAAAYAERATRASAFVVLDEREYGSERPAVNLPAPVAVEADVTAPMHYR